ncbi:Cytochrome P450 [Sphingobium faniae]|nr:Cytochrome P450 [Sphingobium faniae]
MDLDIYDVALRDEDLARTWLDLKEAAPGPVFWTDRNEGHWTILDGRDVERVYTSPDVFSSIDIFIPPNGSRDNVLIPLEMDPPQSIKYRKVIQAAMMPGAIGALVERARSESIAIIEELAPKGHCEFIQDFAGVLPIIVFLALVDLPAEDRHFLVPLAEMSTRPETPEKRIEGHLALRKYLEENIERRRANPGPDLLSKIALAEIDGRQVSMDEALRFASTLMIGGLDTVTNLLGFTALYLANNPDHRRLLLENPDLVPAATDEFVRRFGVVAVARRVIQDVEIGGASMKAGDMVLAPTWMYAVDDAIVSDPLTVDFHRKNGRNLTFGAGAHVCLGMHLAKRELRIFLEEWISRIPEFEVDRDADVSIATGIVSGITAMTLKWPSRVT